MKKNSITLIGVNFYPEDSAIGLYSTQMVEYLSKFYNVDVITGYPYYPEWEIRSDYKNRGRFLEEKKGSINIYRYKQYVPKKPSFKNRIFHLLDWTLGSIRNVFKIKKSDLIICVVPFTSSIALGLFMAKIRGAKVWIHIQDFEFDAAVESGLSGEQKGLKLKIFKGLFWLEKRLLDKADIVSSISYGMIKKLESKTNRPTYFFPNWVDENFIDPSKHKQHKLMQSDKFKILYSGNIGAKQDWNFFIKVVDFFKENSEIEFIIVGAGAKKDWLIENTKEYKNIKHYTPVEYKTLPDLLCSANLHILFQKNDVIDTVMPSKLLGMMASAVPSIVTGSLESEVAKVFDKSKGGLFFDSDAFEKVVESIKKLASDNNTSRNMGINARVYIIEKFSSSKVLESFQEKIEQILSKEN